MMRGFSSLLLTGFMGVGKSTIGRRVATSLNWRFIDCDAELEDRFGCSVPQIFSKYGETSFREAESELCAELSELQNVVVAAGGGLPVERSNLRHFEETRSVQTGAAETNSGGLGWAVVNLTCDSHILWSRLESDQSRPLLQGYAPQQKFDNLIRCRKPVYDSIFLQFDVSNWLIDSDQCLSDFLEYLSTVNDLYQTTLFQRSCRTTDAGYPVLVGDGLIERIPTILRLRGLASHSVLITDSNLETNYGDCSMFEVYNSQVLTPGEAEKNWQTIDSIYRFAANQNASRATNFIGFGGGVVTDMAGFVAATWKRGAKFVSVPTSLLAMVDAGVGGKTGIDRDEGKNLVGAFKQPEIVVIDPSVLKTLPQNQFSCGLAEVVKHALLADEALFHALEVEPDLNSISAVSIARNIQIKINYVEADPNENGVRGYLNLGHTFGHAIERLSHFQLGHGQAVGIGLVMALCLSRSLGFIETDLIARLERFLNRAKLPVSCSEAGLKLTCEAVIESMSQDKKWQSGRRRFIVLEALGKPAFCDNPPMKLIEEAIEYGL